MSLSEVLLIAVGGGGTEQAPKFFLKFQGGSPRSKSDSVNSTFNAFFHRKFSSRYIMVPGGSKKGYCKFGSNVFFLVHFSLPMCFGRRGGGGLGGSPPNPPFAHLWDSHFNII